MNKLPFSSLSTDVDGNKVEENFFTYDENERQQIEINKSNASHVFTPLFIPYYPHIKQRFDLSDTETLLYGFISFYKTTSSGKFYFTNSQLGEMLGRSEKTISLAVSALCSKNIIKTYSKIKAGGGEIRFVELTGNLDISGLQNVKLRITKGNGNNNKIKEKREREEKISHKIEIQEILNHYNEVNGCNRKSLSEGETSNIEKWLEVFTAEDIKLALTKCSQFGFIFGEDRYKKIDLALLFRTKDKRGEPVNYIQQILDRNDEYTKEEYNDRKERGWIK